MEPTLLSQAIAEAIKERFPDEVRDIREFRGQVSVIVKKDRIRDIMEYLHDTPELCFGLLRDLCGVDYYGRERERGTIEQLIVTPLRSWELVVGKIIPYTIIAFINTLAVLAIGSLLFGVPIRGELGLTLALSGLFLLTGLGIGLLASTIANTQQEAMLVVFMSLLPSVFLSGFFFPIEAMPQFLRWISLFIPLRYYLIIVRSLLIKGVGAQVLAQEIFALAVFGFGLMALATSFVFASGWISTHPGESCVSIVEHACLLD